jgi:1-acyl-sn-glycerol-3-phosphate acyltransferase
MTSTSKQSALLAASANMKAVFGPQLAQILSHSDPGLFAVTTPESVYQVAQKQNRERFTSIIEELLLPGSDVGGVENLRRLHELAAQGHPALILSAHVSNLDVPALYTLLKHRGETALFEDIIFIAGRKLTEGCKHVKSMAEVFSRVVISAKTSKMSEQEVSLAMAINKAAQKKIAELQGQGKVFLLYPTGTRSRPGVPRTHHGLREVYNYLRKFEYCVVCGIRGNILPPRDDVDMIDEFPRRDTVVYTFGAVRNIADWLTDLARRQPDAITDRKQFVVDTIMDEIYSLGDDPRLR